MTLVPPRLRADEGQREWYPTSAGDRVGCIAENDQRHCKNKHGFLSYSLVPDPSTYCERSDRNPLRFDGYENYAPYRKHFTLSTNLTTLPSNKYGVVITDRVQGEADMAANKNIDQNYMRRGSDGLNSS